MTARKLKRQPTTAAFPYTVSEETALNERAAMFSNSTGDSTALIFK